jgi:hypothetical protein
VSDFALDFITKNKSKPFFLYYPPLQTITQPLKQMPVVTQIRFAVPRLKPRLEQVFERALPDGIVQMAARRPAGLYSAANDS